VQLEAPPDATPLKKTLVRPPSALISMVGRSNATLLHAFVAVAVAVAVDGCVELPEQPMITAAVRRVATTAELLARIERILTLARLSSRA
jgi:hypothetical protein